MRGVKSVLKTTDKRFKNQRTLPNNVKDVALVDCMRKPLTILNAMIRDHAS